MCFWAHRLQTDKILLSFNFKEFKKHGAKAERRRKHTSEKNEIGKKGVDFVLQKLNTIIANTSSILVFGKSDMERKLPNTEKDKKERREYA